MPTDQITNTVASGITLTVPDYGDPFTVTNTGAVTGPGTGIYAATDWTIQNDGTISGTDQGIVLGQGGSVGNTGSIDATTYGIATGYSRVGYYAATIDNSGTITVTGTQSSHAGVMMQEGGSFTNEAGALVSSAASGVIAHHSSTVVNDGTIVGDHIGLSISGVGTVLNTGTISGAVREGIQFRNGGYASNASAGSITGGYWGVGVYTNAGTVVNDGYIGDTGAAFGLGFGIEFRAGGSVHNTGSIVGGKDGVLVESAPGTLDNAGDIHATGTDSDGVRFTEGGSIHNTGNIAGTGYGVRIDGAAGMLDNAGYIDATETYGEGVRFNYGGSVHNTGTIAGGHFGIIEGAEGTVDNAGVITVTDPVNGYGGVYLDAGGSVTNESTGTIQVAGDGDGVYIGGNSATLENAGTISAPNGFAVALDGVTNRLIVDAGAVFVGGVGAFSDNGDYGNNYANNTLELSGKNGAGSIAGIGDQFHGFGNIVIDPGATWTVAGTMAGFDIATISGLNTHDTLDLTDLNYAAGDTVTLEDGGVLTIRDSGGDVLDTLQLAGDFTGDFFHLHDAGPNGTTITEDGTPCYCRGTLILTDKGEVAVEGLRIGDRLITAAGKARPIRWIGKRSYSGRFAAGNRNVLPILIKQGALDGALPRRDLWISPLHAMYLDGVLIPASVLVNGVSIIQATQVETVEYFHLELESHDVIVAEGAWSESFLDDDSRNMFHNASDYRALYPHAVHKPARYCAPRVEDGEILQVVRDRIAALIARDHAVARAYD